MNDTRMPEEAGAPRSSAPDEAGHEMQPWEQIEDGRYRPRRIRGSCVGRVLG